MSDVPAVVPSVSGLVTHDPPTWNVAATRLVDDPARRSSVGGFAHAARHGCAAEHWAVDVQLSGLPLELEELLELDALVELEELLALEALLALDTADVLLELAEVLALAGADAPPAAPAGASLPPLPPAPLDALAALDALVAPPIPPDVLDTVDVVDVVDVADVADAEPPALVPAPLLELEIPFQPVLELDPELFDEEGVMPVAQPPA